MTELAIYGGTFDPVHIGHLKAADEFFKAVSPDKLLIIPTLIPPHKRFSLTDDPEDRLNMLKIAFGSHPEYGKRIFISDYEITSPPPSYTVNTLRHFKSDDTRITFLMGTDMFLTIDKWYKPDEIMKLCRLAFMLRENDDPDTVQKVENQRKFLTCSYGADIIQIHASPIEISSSEIRNGGDEIRKKYLPEGVYSYIKERSLYNGDGK